MIDDAGARRDVQALTGELWDRAQSAAVAVADSLAGANLPDRDRLTELLEFAELAAKVLPAIEEALPGQPRSRGGLRSAAEEPDEDVPWLTQLAGVCVPAPAEDGAERLRAAARAALADRRLDRDRLRALHDLITTAPGTAADFARLADVDRTARVLLPDAPTLVLAIVRGLVTFPGTAPAAPPAAESPAPPPEVAAPASPVLAPEVAAPVRAVVGPASSASAREVAGPVAEMVGPASSASAREVAGPVAEMAGPASPAPVPEVAGPVAETSAPAVDPPPPVDRSAAGRLDDVDQMLAAGAADVFRDLTGRRSALPGPAARRLTGPAAPAPPAARPPGGESSAARRPAAPLGPPPAAGEPVVAAPATESADLRTVLTAAAAEPDPARGGHDRSGDDRGGHDRAGDDRAGDDRAAHDRASDDRAAHGRSGQEWRAALLRQGRFGLAADLAEAAGASAASVCARRLAALAVALRQPAGPVASAFAAATEQVRREDMGEDRLGQLTAWVAAARVALLAPGAGPAAVLAEIAPSLTASAALSRVGDLLGDASRSGLIVHADAASEVGEVAALERAAAEAAEEADRLVREARHRTIKYEPANHVYQAWMAERGELGSLLAQVAGNRAGAVAGVRDRLLDLRGKADKRIAERYSALKRSRRKRIVGNPHTVLVERWDAAVEAAAAWVALRERLAGAAADGPAKAWQAGPLAKLRGGLAPVRDRALAEFAELVGAEGADGQLARLLAEAFAVCDGAGPTGEELPAGYAAHAELLAAPLPLDPRTLQPLAEPAQTVRALAGLAAAEPAGAEPVYQLRAGRGDHELTAVLIAGVRVAHPQLAAELEQRRGRDIAAMSGLVAAELAELRGLVDSRRMAGALDDTRWSGLAARAQGLAEPASRRDYGRIRAEIGRIRADLDRARDALAAQATDRIGQHAAGNPRVAEVAGTLVDLVDAGQLASADEYLQQVLAGGTLPANETAADPFAGFFPALPDFAAGRASLLGQVRDALVGRAATQATRTTLARLGVDLDALPQSRREAGRQAIDSWLELALRPKGERSRRRQLDVITLLRAVLGEAGLEFRDAKTDPAGAGAGRQWVTLHQVQGTGSALTPALGSAMSPDGRTLRVLLVRAAPSPATVVEWMAGEARDHTVLALWLARPLSAADRRSIADAARGRPHPPVLVLDEAALVYLIGQREPRRSTFAATALPFTSASPYRDTPGDVAPEMFYGRTEELAEVQDMFGSSFCSGGRQLGKSALLRTAARRFEGAGADGRVAVLTSAYTVGGDGRPERLWELLWPRLAERGIVAGPPPERAVAAAIHAAITRWIEADSRRALLVLLDEADAFLDADAAGNRFEHVDWCRRIMLDTGRRAKVVFAGLHRTTRFESLPNQPLSHFGRPIVVGPLRPQHAYDLLTRPLAALGLRFADPVGTPARVLARANNLPALLQLFGEALTRHLTSRPVPAAGPPQLITDDDVDEVLANPGLIAAFREKYVLTLDLDHRYKVIAYAVAQAAHEFGIDASLTIGQIEAACRQAWPAGFARVRVDDLRGLVSECVDLGVLAAEAGRYRLRTPTVLRLLGTEEEVLEVLTTADERLRVPAPFDGGAYRRQLGPARSPLTEGQLGVLLAARREAVVVGGSRATGVDEVPAALEAAVRDGAARVSRLVRCRAASPDGVAAALDKLTADGVLVLVDARSLSAAGLRELLPAAGDAVAGAARSAVVAVLAGAGNAAGWVDWPRRIELSRVDDTGLRPWVDEYNLPFRDDGTRRQLEEATGGWPLLLARVTELSGRQGPTATAATVLGELAEAGTRRPAAELLAAAGVGAGTALGTVFALTAGLTAAVGEDLDSLAELLDLDDGTAELAAALSAAGFPGRRAARTALVALTRLGCLVEDADGCWSAEPVLGRLLARAGSPGADPARSR